MESNFMFESPQIKQSFSSLPLKEVAIEGASNIVSRVFVHRHLLAGGCLLAFLLLSVLASPRIRRPAPYGPYDIILRLSPLSTSRRE